jgi:hypothetical protein
MHKDFYSFFKDDYYGRSCIVYQSKTKKMAQCINKTVTLKEVGVKIFNY